MGGIPLRCNKSPIAAETFIAVGAEPVQIGLEEINEAVKDGLVQGGESTYARFYGLNQNECCGLINDAEHSLFLTSIIVSQRFWSSLEQDLQAMIKDASFDAARMERRESLEDAEIVKQKCAQEHTEIFTMPDEE